MKTLINFQILKHNLMQSLTEPQAKWADSPAFDEYVRLILEALTLHIDERPEPQEIAHARQEFVEYCIWSEENEEKLAKQKWVRQYD